MMLSGDNGILNRSTQASENTRAGIVQERIDLAVAENKTIEYTDDGIKKMKEDIIKELKNDGFLEESEVTILQTTDTITIGTIIVDFSKLGTSTQTTIKEAREAGTVFNGTESPLVDNYGNEIIVPAGFKIIIGDNVTEGVVIQDENAKNDTSKGNQFVWIPVGTIYTNELKTESKTIELGRYVFVDDSNTKTGIPVSLAQDFMNTSGYHYWAKNNFFEEKTSRINQAGTNATAKNLNGFLSKSIKGFYIGRYEAGVENGTLNITNEWHYNSNESWTGYTGGTLVEKKDKQVYNYITQNKAAELSRDMYSNLQNFESDLINSYAWDTAVLFLQEFGEENYSIKNNTDYSIYNTGTTADHPCNVYDMANNCIEWTTESYNDPECKCVIRGRPMRESMRIAEYYPVSPRSIC